MFFTTASTVTKDEFQFQIFPTDFRVKLATLMMMTPAADRQRLGISRLPVRTAFCAGLLRGEQGGLLDNAGQRPGHLADHNCSRTVVVIKAPPYVCRDRFFFFFENIGLSRHS